MKLPSLRLLGAALVAALAVSAALPPALVAPAHADDPAAPPSYDAVADLQNMTAAYGRIVGPGGQLQNPAYLPALVQQGTIVQTAQLLAQVADPLRLSLTPAMAVPGWNVGNPLRASWAGTRGRQRKVAYTNRFGAKLAATLYAPLPDARDPYTHQVLRAPYPAVVITPGSVGGSQGMYQWLAEDLAERGYLVLLFDVQGEGTSETLPHTSGQPFPFCNPFGAVAGDPALGTKEMSPCPGVPFQQLSNFTAGTVDTLDFLVSTPSRPYRNPGAAGTRVDAFNPWWQLWDRRPLAHPTAPGRTSRIAIIGHSMGAAAVSYVQAYDDRVATVVALDKLSGGKGGVPTQQGPVVPKVPALALQSEYGFSVTPWQLSGGSSLVPAAGNPDRMRERATGFDLWRSRGVDSMLVVPRASTHLEYTDIPLVLPASRWGQALSSVYVQRWLDAYLRGGPTAPLLADSFSYLEPRGHGVWQPVTLQRDPLLSGRYCSAYDFAGHVDTDWTDLGCP
ncbi:MAG TPA: alpha/beta hydrolase [Nocardioides sp.]|nr:alpha/beta hydrolase [Nocardioides sp.]